MEYDKYGNKVAEAPSTGLAILTVLVTLSAMVLHLLGVEGLTIFLIELLFVTNVTFIASLLR